MSRSAAAHGGWGSHWTTEGWRDVQLSPLTSEGTFLDFSGKPPLTYSSPFSLPYHDCKQDSINHVQKGLVGVGGLSGIVWSPKCHLCRCADLFVVDSYRASCKCQETHLRKLNQAALTPGFVCCSWTLLPVWLGKKKSLVFQLSYQVFFFHLKIRNPTI